MHVQSSIADGYILVSVQGRIDSITAGEFESQVMPLAENDITKIVFDCTQLDYISSSGLRVFLIILKKITARGGALHLCGLQPKIKEIFDISGFSKIFQIHADIATATAR